MQKWVGWGFFWKSGELCPRCDCTRDRVVVGGWVVAEGAQVKMFTNFDLPDLQNCYRYLTATIITSTDHHDPRPVRATPLRPQIPTLGIFQKKPPSRISQKKPPRAHFTTFTHLVRTLCTGSVQVNMADMDFLGMPALAPTTDNKCAHSAASAQPEVSAVALLARAQGIVKQQRMQLREMRADAKEIRRKCGTTNGVVAIAADFASALRACTHKHAKELRALSHEYKDRANAELQAPSEFVCAAVIFADGSYTATQDLHKLVETKTKGKRKLTATLSAGSDDHKSKRPNPNPKNVRGPGALSGAVKASWMQPSCWNKDGSIFSRPSISFENIPCFKERNWTSVDAAKDGIINIRNGNRTGAGFKVQGPLDLFAAPGNEKWFDSHDFKGFVKHWVTMGEFAPDSGVVGKRHLIALTLWPGLFERSAVSWNKIADNDPLKDVKNYIKRKAVTYSVAINAMDRFMGYNFATTSSVSEEEEEDSAVGA